MKRKEFYDALYLAHHGIKGQKWGKRNGPPYPLDEEDHSPSEQVQKKGLPDGAKRAIKVGTWIAVAALATYGAYKLYQSGALSDIGIKKAAEVVDTSTESVRAKGHGSSLPDWIPVNKNYSHDIEADLKRVNPTLTQKEAYDNIPFELLAHDGVPMNKCNCQACSFVDELICRGVDAQAAMVDTRNLGYSEDIVLDKLYKNAKHDVFDISSWDDLPSILSKYGEGSRGNVEIDYIGGGGHSLRFEVSGGRSIIKDTQSGFGFYSDWSKAETMWTKGYNASKSNIHITRTDNLDILDSDMLRQFAVITESK